MQRLLVTGASGMLGSHLVELLSDEFEVFGTGKRPIPINSTRPYKSLDFLGEGFSKLVDWCSPDLVVHCAALTDVDYCESHPKLAARLNTESVQRLALDTHPAKIVYISTDAVFPPTSSLSKENEKPLPFNVYGWSKLGGERVVGALDGGLIIRTTPVATRRIKPGPSFIDWILDSVARDACVGLFHDVVFSPASSAHIAAAIKKLLLHGCSGTWHVGSKSPISKYEFGKMLISRLGGESAQVVPVSLSDHRFFAKRSKDQSLCCDKVEQEVGLATPTAGEVVDQIANEVKSLND